jgi:hypothetical protein
MNDCACVYASAGESYSVGSTLMRRARIKHTCGECNRTINPGEIYEYQTGCCDGQWYDAKTCSDCLSMRKSFFCKGYAFNGIWDDLHCHIDGMFGEISSECIVKLTPRAREMVCELIEEVWEKYYDE